MVAARGGAGPVFESFRAQRPVGLDYLALGMRPLGLYRTEPRALLRRRALQDARPLTRGLHLRVARPHPPRRHPARTPGRVVPRQRQRGPAQSIGPPAAPPGIPARQLGYGPAVREAQPRPRPQAPVLPAQGRVQPVARRSLRLLLRPPTPPSFRSAPAPPPPSTRARPPPPRFYSRGRRIGPPPPPPRVQSAATPRHLASPTLARGHASLGVHPW